MNILYYIIGYLLYTLITMVLSFKLIFELGIQSVLLGSIVFLTIHLGIRKVAELVVRNS